MPDDMRERKPKGDYDEDDGADDRAYRCLGIRVSGIQPLIGVDRHICTAIACE